MDRDDLTRRYDAAVRRHWRSCMDHSGPTPALIGELVTIAAEHAASTRTEPDGHPAPVAAGEPQPAPAGSAGTAGPSHRTRTRPRGGAK